ncbi:MAG: hypothetical protein ACTHMP_24845 [Thermomicrobiales bacterium]
MAHEPPAAEVASPARPFDPGRRCCVCGQPAQRWVGGTRYEPVFAGGYCGAGGGFRQLTVLCSACASSHTLEACLWSARQQAATPSAVCYIYQLRGPPAVRTQVDRFVANLRR